MTVELLVWVLTINTMMMVAMFYFDLVADGFVITWRLVTSSVATLVSLGLLIYVASAL